MTSDIVALKGTKTGLLITLSPTEDWQKITAELAARIDEQKSFFSGARVTVNVGERPVPKYELSSLKALLERRNLILLVVESGSATTIDSAHALDLRANVLQESLNQDHRVDEKRSDASLPIDSEEFGTTGVMVKRTLRSGRTIHSQGHVIVLGDVNPGAQIIASGDIVVWGRLRGTAHAGAEGDTSAVICALDMNPNQLRIADLIATAPSENNARTPRPEVASVRDDKYIVVDTWG